MPQEPKESWDRMYSECEKFQDNAGSIGLGDIADIHVELLYKAISTALAQRDKELREKIEAKKKKEENDDPFDYVNGAKIGALNYVLSLLNKQ